MCVEATCTDMTPIRSSSSLPRSTSQLSRLPDCSSDSELGFEETEDEEVEEDHEVIVIPESPEPVASKSSMAHFAPPSPCVAATAAVEAARHGPRHDHCAHKAARLMKRPSSALKRPAAASSANPPSKKSAALPASMRSAAAAASDHDSLVARAAVLCSDPSSGNCVCRIYKCKQRGKWLWLILSCGTKKQLAMVSEAQYNLDHKMAERAAGVLLAIASLGASCGDLQKIKQSKITRS